MTGYLTQQTHLARLNDMRNLADERRPVRRPSTNREETPMHATESIAIRRATEADRVTVERLAALDSAAVPSGEILLAEVGDEPRAAIEIASGATIADPFQRTADVVELLSLRAASLREGVVSTRRLRLRTRSAYRAA